MAVRKIKSYEDDFDPLEFCKQAEKIYIDTHKAMSDKDLDKLKECVTERAYPETIYNIDCKTIHWKYLKNIEVPRIVHARCTDLITKDNIFGQITVRFHSQQVSKWSFKKFVSNNHKLVARVNLSNCNIY